MTQLGYHTPIRYRITVKYVKIGVFFGVVFQSTLKPGELGDNMIYTIYRTSDGIIQTDLPNDMLNVSRMDTTGMLWVDIVEEPIEKCTEILKDMFAFHPLAIEDALIDTHVPKVDDWEDYLYLVLHAVKLQDTQPTAVEDVKICIDTHELDCFLGPNYLVTYQVSAINAVTQLRQKAITDNRKFARNPTYLLYVLMDAMVDEYMKTLDKLDDEIDWIEDRVFNNPTQDLPEKIFTLRRALLRLRRILAPQREVLSKLARGDFKTIDESGRIYFRDLHDHIVRMHDITEGMRDLIGSALDTYLSVINNRMNDVMKVLTVITTLFMPMSFLSGFFGMNFFQPVRSDTAAFFVMFTLMFISPISLYLLMRKRAWL